MRKLCRREWNWLCVNQHSWDPWQRTPWSQRVTSDFNSVFLTFSANCRAANIGWEFGVRNARGRPLPAYKVTQVPKKLMSWWADEWLRTLFFFDLKIFASILQGHSRGTLRTSQTSDKQKKKKKTTLCERFLYHRESVTKSHFHHVTDRRKRWQHRKTWYFNKVLGTRTFCLLYQ